MRKVFLLLALCAASFAGANETLVFADGLWRRGLYSQAAAEYESLLKTLPEDIDRTEVVFRLAECYERMNRYETAMKCYRTIADKTGGERSLAARLRQAAMLLALKRPKEALTLLETVATAPGISKDLRTAALYRAGLCCEELDRPGDAVSYYNALVRQGGQYASYARLRLALNFGQSGKSKEALALCEQIVQDPEAKAQHEEASLLAFGLAYAAGDFERAAAEARRVGEKALAKRQYLLQAAWAAVKSGAAAEARAWLAAEKVRSPQPTDSRLWLEATIANALSDRTAARTAYERILAEFPDGACAAQAAEAVLILQAQEGNAAEWLALYQRVERGLTPEARLGLAPLLLDFALRAQDRTAAGAAAAELKAHGTPEQAAESAYRIAWLDSQAGETAAAGEAWLALAQQWPGLPIAARAAYAAAYAFTQAKQTDRAEIATRLAITSGDPAVVPDALMLKARAELAENDVEAAATTLDETLARFPNHASAAEASYLRGLIFFNAKDFAAAERCLEKALAFGQEVADGPAPLSHSRRTDAALRRAQCLHALGRGEEAAALLQPLIALKDTQTLAPEYLRWLAEFQIGRGAWAEAEDAAKILADRTESAADRALAHLYLGRAAEGRGQRATAIAAYEAALGQGQPLETDAEAACALGTLYAAEGSHEKACAAFNRAAAQANSDTASGRTLRAKATEGLALACAALGRDAEALRADMGLIIFFDDPVLVPAAFRRAIARLEAQGRADEAETLRAELKQRYPDAE